MGGPSLRLVCVNDVYSLEMLPRLATLVRRAAEVEPADALLVTLAGDFIAPSLLGSLDAGRGMVDCLNHVGVTHVTLGNHEDDVPAEELRRRIGELAGVFLATNVRGFDARLRAHDVVTVGRVRVGLVGVVMEDRATYRRPPFGGGVEPAVESALREIALLTGELGCDATIALTHQFLEKDRELARRATRLALIAGGHEHTLAVEEVGGTWIVKAGAEATHAVIADLVWPAEPGPPRVSVRVEEVASHAEDPELRARVDRHLAPVRALGQATLRTIPPGQALSSVGARRQQTSMGTLLCSTLRDALGADACFYNGGGIRGAREYRGRITFGDLEVELPFDNECVVVSLPGRVVAAAIEASRRRAPAEWGGYLEIDDRLDPAALEPERSYRVATVRNILAGLDGNEPLARHLAEHPGTVPPEGSGRETKLILVEAFARSLWRSLGAFADLDTDGDGRVDAGELAAALARATGEPASPMTVELVLDTLDRDGDRAISPAEGEDPDGG